MQLGDRQVFCADEDQMNVEVWLGQAMQMSVISDSSFVFPIRMDATKKFDYDH